MSWNFIKVAVCPKKKKQKKKTVDATWKLQQGVAPNHFTYCDEIYQVIWIYCGQSKKSSQKYTSWRRLLVFHKSNKPL